MGERSGTVERSDGSALTPTGTGTSTLDADDAAAVNTGLGVTVARPDASSPRLLVPVGLAFANAGARAFVEGNDENETGGRRPVLLP